MNAEPPWHALLPPSLEVPFLPQAVLDQPQAGLQQSQYREAQPSFPPCTGGSVGPLDIEPPAPVAPPAEAELPPEPEPVPVPAVHFLQVA